jgi:hypothetical protein
MLEEAEMSQIDNAGTSSSKPKRANRKRQPLSVSRETENVCIQKKKRIKQLLFIDKQLKDDLDHLCETTY